MGDIEYLKSNSRSKNVESISDWLGAEYVDKLREFGIVDKERITMNTDGDGPTVSLMRTVAVMRE